MIIRFNLIILIRVQDRIAEPIGKVTILKIRMKDKQTKKANLSMGPWL